MPNSENVEPMELDRFDDIVILALAEIGEDGIYRSALHDVLIMVDPEKFDFEVFDDYAEMMETLRLLDGLDFVPTVRQRRRLKLTDKGQETARRLEAGAEDDHLRAIKEAVDAN